MTEIIAGGKPMGPCLPGSMDPYARDVAAMLP
jgi:hypothetical protein